MAVVFLLLPDHQDIVGYDNTLQNFTTWLKETDRFPIMIIDEAQNLVLDGCIGKKGATYAAFFRGFTNVWGVSRSWAAADR